MILDRTHALTVYGPDVLISNLQPQLDAFIETRSEVQLVERFFTLHDEQSIAAFYGLSDSTSAAHWPLVVDLFDGRPCLVSIWRGENALHDLQALKGATQPACANMNTIRGNFWCDNPVCNLVHVSDSFELACEELLLLRSRALCSAGLPMPGRPAQIMAGHRHSALHQFCRIVSRISPEDRVPDLAGHPTAMAAATVLIRHLLSLTKRRPDLADLVHQFLGGNLNLLQAGDRRLPRLGAWERLLIECGSHSNPMWLARYKLIEAAESKAWSI